MKRPVEADFDTSVAEAGVTVTFKPTNSIYSFYRLANTDDIARLEPVSPGNIRHAGPTGDTPLMRFKTWRCGLRLTPPQQFGRPSNKLNDAQTVWAEYAD
jgi:hypothetical protein